MLGAIIGDMAGSRFEWHPTKSKDFELLTKSGGCKPTDDSVMTLAIADGALAYVLLTALSCKKACDNFEKIDL